MFVVLMFVALCLWLFVAVCGLTEEVCRGIVWPFETGRSVSFPSPSRIIRSIEAISEKRHEMNMPHSDIFVARDSHMRKTRRLNCWLCTAPQADHAALGQCIDGDLILTVPTDVLQGYVSDHSYDEQVFPELDDG